MTAAKLETRVLEKIREAHPGGLTRVGKAVGAGCTTREVDAILRGLKAAGLIRYVKKVGWVLADGAAP